MGAKGQKLTAEQRAKISAARRRYLASLPAPVEDPTHKRCSKCGETKPLSEFHWSTRKPKGKQATRRPESACKVCKLAQNKETRERERLQGKDAYARWTQWWERKRVKDPAYYQRFLERKREREAIKRREEGCRVLERPGQGGRGSLLATEPLALFLEDEMKGRSFQAISEAAGINQRQLTTILSREYPTVSLRTVDRFLTGLGAPEALSILYPE